MRLNAIYCVKAQGEEMDFKAIEHITEYRLTWDEFTSIPEDQRAAVAVASYAVSEINALSRLYLFAVQEMTGNPVIDGAVFIQANVLLRAVSSKVFEFTQLINLKDNHNKTNDPIVKKIFSDAEVAFQELKNREGFRLAQAIRNEASNHYRLKPARNNMKGLAEQARLSFCMNRMSGNSYHPLGEEFMFIARLNRAGQKAETKEDKLKLHSEWFEWNIDAVRWVNGVFRELMKEIVLKKFPSKRAVKVPHWIDPKLVGEVDDHKAPIFLRTHNWSRKLAS
ncbi:hypothetical protein [Ruegeria arenilitoris]|uniref:hypothetical protein n=1 Tax=Ruegeria arenilitoris TaxID=1173585 RepID=UPI001C2B9F74|nr:hypothetical protein [Ruegeria arenilitoris]